MQIDNNIGLNKDIIQKDQFKDLALSLSFDQAININQAAASGEFRQPSVDDFISAAEPLSPVTVKKEETAEIGLLRSAEPVVERENKRTLNYDILSKVNTSIASLILNSKKASQAVVKKIANLDIAIGSDKKQSKE